MISFEHVTKRYEETKDTVLEDISFHIKKGDFVFFTGDSGAGKTTLLRLLLKETEPSMGTIRVNGRELLKISHNRIPAYRRQIGVVFQDLRLMKDKNVYQNVSFVMQVFGMRKNAIDRRVSAVLSFLGLAQKFHDYPENLSGGEQQKVCLARAIVNQPVLLLADEPTGSLDPVSAREIMRYLELLWKNGTTILCICHDEQLMKEMEFPRIFIEDGRISRGKSTYDELF